MGGEIHGELGRIRSLSLGGHELKRVVTGFPQKSEIDRDGTIGMEVLNRFRVTIDYPGKRLFLKRGDRFGEGFEADMTGMGDQAEF